MGEFTCLTCQLVAEGDEISKHLAQTRHKTVKYNDVDETIECEECDDSNIHTLVVARFGLSDMALLCQECLSKEDKPATQYALSNGSLFKKIEQYYTYRDTQCMECGSENKLNVQKGHPEVVLCKDCLAKGIFNQSNFVSENDENFLGELLGIKEFIPKNLKTRSHRKGDRKGGKKGKRESRPKKVTQETEQRRAHYENSRATSMAIKSGKTMLAVGSESPTPTRSKSPTLPQKSRAKESSPAKLSFSKKKQATFNGPSISEKSKLSSNRSVPTKGKSTFNKGANGSHSSMPTQKQAFASSKLKESHSKEEGDKKVRESNKSSSKDSKGVKVSLKKPEKGNIKKADIKKADFKKIDGKKKENQKAGPKKNENEKANFKKRENGKDESANKKAPKDIANTKSQKNGTKTQEQAQFVLPPNISKYVPSPETKLSYESINSYFKEMSYNLYLEEKLSNDASNLNLFIDSSDMTIEWYAEQDKKYKQYKVSILVDETFAKRFISKKMLNFKKTPFSLSQTIFLVLNDEIFWPGQIVTSDTKSATKNRKNGPKIYEMVIQLYDWNDQPLPVSVNVHWLKIMPASVPISRVFLAMSRIENSKFTKMILGKEQIRQISFKNYVKYSRDTLNDSQKVAVQSVLNNSITVLKGPPGTGKTSTIYEIVLQLLENLNTYPILVVAASNIAIDNIAEKLLLRHERSILRIVSNEKEKEYNREHPLAAICLHHKVYDALPLSMKQALDDIRFNSGRNVSQNMYKNLLAKQISLSNTFIAQARVIFSTTVVAGGNQLKSVSKLPVVIMDEATQSTEPTTLIPMSMPGVDKFVFVGDQKQLSSFTQVPKLSLSLFERVLLNGTYKEPHMLDTQYRMHPMISEFPRKRFYDGLLKDGITAEDRYLEGIPKNPVYFWDTVGKVPEQRVRVGFREDRGYTYTNKGEADMIIKVLIDLIYNKNIPKSEIGIVTPYRGQRDLISSIMVGNDLINPEKDIIHEDDDRDDIYNETKTVTVQIVSNIMVASVDAFQGREKNIIIMSCVRSNTDNKIGFLTDERRLNVALTRAKYSLILVGDASCLSKSSTLWKEYLDHLKEKNSVFGSEEFTY
ncbi:uncharacterized protein PRCAT00006259001 [Priceomyces carsonii]|uniref:uncharacterized protein n=1 Tax=Priceomyces carsonii TaxID=28549 RepID=UPI002ED9F271|nr:unnamed protein product [Priceomyces carsonii]